MSAPCSLRRMIKVPVQLFGIECIIYWKLKNNSILLVLIKALSLKKDFWQILLNAAIIFWGGLKAKGLISQKYYSYFSYKFKKSIYLGTFYVLPKIHRRLYGLFERPVTSNCVTSTEKAPEFVDFRLKI